MLVIYAIREISLPSFNQSKTTINANAYNRAKGSLANFAAGLKSPALALVA